MSLVMLANMLVPVVVALALVAIAVALVRGGARGASVPTDRPGLLEQRLEHLDRLHAAGRISDVERADARARLLGTL
ncbi:MULTISPECIES: hypothetical protein [Isoptericola]|nr:hypothetical protein [Isoptericola sp. AK164]